MTEERKHAILFFSATILAARKLAEIGDKPCPAREMCIFSPNESAGFVRQCSNRTAPGQASKNECPIS